MYKRYAITLPEELVKKVEKERKETGLNRSEFFRKAVTLFIGLDVKTEKKLDNKYGPIYKSLNDYNTETSDEMMEIASKTISEGEKIIIMNNISINRGDIVILDFGRPASQDDHTAAKTRPALVIQNNVANRNSPLTIVSTITTNPKVELLPVGIKLEPGQTGLEQISYVDLGHIYTINKVSIKKVIGSVHRVDMSKIDNAIEISLGIKEYPL